MSSQTLRYSNDPEELARQLSELDPRMFFPMAAGSDIDWTSPFATSQATDCSTYVNHNQDNDTGLVGSTAQCLGLEETLELPGKPCFGHGMMFWATTCPKARSMKQCGPHQLNVWSENDVERGTRTEQMYICLERYCPVSSLGALPLSALTAVENTLETLSKYQGRVQVSIFRTFRHSLTLSEKHQDEAVASVEHYENALFEIIRKAKQSPTAAKHKKKTAKFKKDRSFDGLKISQTTTVESRESYQSSEELTEYHLGVGEGVGSGSGELAL